MFLPALGREDMHLAYVDSLDTVGLSIGYIYIYIHRHRLTHTHTIPYPGNTPFVHPHSYPIMTADNLNEFFSVVDTPFSLNFKAVGSTESSGKGPSTNSNNTSASASASTIDMKHNRFIQHDSLDRSLTANTSLSNLDEITKDLDFDIDIDINSNGNLDDNSYVYNDIISISGTDDSPQFVDPYLINHHHDGKTPAFHSNNSDKNIDTLLDDYVSNELLINNNLFSTNHIDRRYSEVITNPLKAMTNQRNSISHSIDFWNLPNGSLGKNDSAGTPSFDDRVAQLLNGFNMNFSDDKSKIFMKPTNVSTTNFNNNYNSSSSNPQYSIKKQHQRNSTSLIDSNSLKANEKLLSKIKNDSSITPSIHYENAILSDDEDELDHMLKSPKSSSSRANSSINPANFQLPLQPLQQQQPQQQFIKPSMILSENASQAAKVATSGTETPNMLPDFLGANSNYDILINPTIKLNNSPVQSYFSKPPRKPIGAEVASTPSSTASSNSTTPARRRHSVSKSVTPINFEDEEAKPFKCSNCEKAFRRSEHLKRHIRSVHSTDRPFACTFCEKKFSRSDNLSQHLKTHKKHGDF